MKICVPIVNRTNYSKLKPILKALKKESDIEFSIVASSSLILEKYGFGIENIIQDGFKVGKIIDCTLMNDTHEAMAKTVALSISEHASYFANNQFDVVLVVGDRFDMLGAVVPAMLMNLKIIHIQGGEESGTIDNTVRDIFSRAASLHLVSTEKAKKRLESMGINPETILNFGCTSVEYIKKLVLERRELNTQINEKFKTKVNLALDEKFLIVLFHPDTTKDEDVEIDDIIERLIKLGLKIFYFYPNIDAKNSILIKKMSKFKSNKNVIFVKHMKLEAFVNLMAHAACMIGNSSAGIREAASFGTPVINIGSRQNNREKNDNTLSLDKDYSDLEFIVRDLAEKRFPKNNLYFKEGALDNTVKAIKKFSDKKI